MDVDGILGWEDAVLILSCRVDHMQLKVLKQKILERAQIMIRGASPLNF